MTTTVLPNVGDYKLDYETGQAFVWNGKAWVNMASGLNPPMVITVNKRVKDERLLSVIHRARDYVASKNRMGELSLTHRQFDMLMRSGGTWVLTAGEPVSGTLFGMNVKVNR